MKFKQVLQAILQGLGTSSTMSATQDSSATSDRGTAASSTTRKAATECVIIEYLAPAPLVLQDAVARSGSQIT